MSLSELAKRCEQATGPDSKLDAAIEKVLPCSVRFARNNPHAPRTLWNERGAAFHGARIGDCDSQEEYRAERFTASLDAAMSLVPEGKTMMLQTRFNGYHAEVAWPHAGNAPTAALALCAAALRARDAQGIEAQRAGTTKIGSVHESPVRDSECAPKDAQP